MPPPPSALCSADQHARANRIRVRLQVCTGSPPQLHTSDGELLDRALSSNLKSVFFERPAELQTLNYSSRNYQTDTENFKNYQTDTESFISRDEVQAGLADLVPEDYGPLRGSPEANKAAPSPPEHNGHERGGMALPGSALFNPVIETTAPPSLYALGTPGFPENRPRCSLVCRIAFPLSRGTICDSARACGRGPFTPHSPIVSPLPFRRPQGRPQRGASG